MNSYVRYIAHCVDVIRCSTSILLCPWWFLGGCTRLLLYFNTNKRHSFFFCRIPAVLENRRSPQGGGVRTPCTHPLDPPPQTGRNSQNRRAKPAESTLATSRLLNSDHVQFFRLYHHRGAWSQEAPNDSFLLNTF